MNTPGQFYSRSFTTRCYQSVLLLYSNYQFIIIPVCFSPPAVEIIGQKCFENCQSSWARSHFSSWVLHPLYLIAVLNRGETGQSLSKLASRCFYGYMKRKNYFISAVQLIDTDIPFGPTMVIPRLSSRATR